MKKRKEIYIIVKPIHSHFAQNLKIYAQVK